MNKKESKTFVYKIVDEWTDDAVGMIQLSHVDRIAKNAVVGRFWLKEHLRNKGVGAAALRKLIEKAADSR